MTLASVWLSVSRISCQLLARVCSASTVAWMLLAAASGKSAVMAFAAQTGSEARFCKAVMHRFRAITVEVAERPHEAFLSQVQPGFAIASEAIAPADDARLVTMKELLHRLIAGRSPTVAVGCDQFLIGHSFPIIKSNCGENAAVS